MEEALRILRAYSRASRRSLKTLHDVGLGYIQLGQSATTLSGGEAQRVKLATELAQAADRADALHPGRTDHRPALCRYRKTARRAAAPGRCRQHGRGHRAQSGCDQNADWIIDLGPEGGDGAAKSSPKARPEEIAKSKRSYTGQVLKEAGV